MEIAQVIDHFATETASGASSRALVGGGDTSPVRAIVARGAAPANDGSRWTTLVELTVGPYQYRLIRCDAKKLTRREAEVIERVMRGCSNKVIAYDLGIAHATVRVLVFRAMFKLGVRKRADLVALLQEMATEGPAPLNATPL